MKPTHTPGRHVRVPDELWAAAMARARDDEQTVSEVVRAALAVYVGTRRRAPADSKEKS